jgi:acetylornithine deacetylase/succinyl-diaminopimelate desuccinylase-like protein
MRSKDEPSVIAAGAELISRLFELDSRLQYASHPVAGSASVFIGQIHSGEIFNQYPQECWLEGTRRWLPGTDHREVESELRALLRQLELDTGTKIECDWFFIRDAFDIDPSCGLVGAFQGCYEAVSGKLLPIGPKPFVDDGNSFGSVGKVPAITHGPRAGGQHTISEWVEVDDLVRVALLYAATAVVYCSAGE